MRWTTVYTALIVLGALIIIAGFLFPVSTFIVFLSIGSLFVLGGAYERWKLNKKPVLTAATLMHPELKTINSTMQPTAIQTEEKKSRFSFFKKKPNIPMQPALQQNQQEPAISPTEDQTIVKKDAVTIFMKPTTEDQKTKSVQELEKYIKQLLKSGIEKEKIKELSIQSNWPEDLFEKTFAKITENIKRKKLIALSIGLFSIFIVIIVLAKYGLFVLPLWIKNLGGASPFFYLGLSFVVLAIALFIGLKVRTIVQKKNVEYRVVESKNVDEIKTSLKKFEGSYETDLDKLYKILTDKGKLTTTEVAQGFNISKEQAEEWGKILRDQELITLHYPTVGDPELIWKKLKSIE